MVSPSLLSTLTELGLCIPYLYAAYTSGHYVMNMFRGQANSRNIHAWLRFWLVNILLHLMMTLVLWIGYGVLLVGYSAYGVQNEQNTLAYLQGDSVNQTMGEDALPSVSQSNEISGKTLLPYDEWAELTFPLLKLLVRATESILITTMIKYRRIPDNIYKSVIHPILEQNESEIQTIVQGTRQLADVVIEIIHEASLYGLTWLVMKTSGDHGRAISLIHQISQQAVQGSAPTRNNGNVVAQTGRDSGMQRHSMPARSGLYHYSQRYSDPDIQEALEEVRAKEEAKRRRALQRSSSQVNRNTTGGSLVDGEHDDADADADADEGNHLFRSNSVVSSSSLVSNSHMDTIPRFFTAGGTVTPATSRDPRNAEDAKKREDAKIARIGSAKTVTYEDVKALRKQFQERVKHKGTSANKKA